MNHLNKLWLVFIVVISLTSICSTSGADRSFDYAVESDSLSVDGNWSIENYRHAIYGAYDDGLSVKAAKRAHTLVSVGYLPPFNLISLIYFKVLGRDSGQDGAKILAACKKPGWLVEAQISCISLKISYYVTTLPSYSNGILFDGRTFCAVAANLFVNVFNGLEIPRSAAGYLDASISPPALHVVNSFTLTSSDGVTYGYVTDVGSRPGVVYASSIAAQNFAKKQKPYPDGSRSMQFPRLDFKNPGVKYFGPRAP